MVGRTELESLLAFVSAGGRVCPLPYRWIELWRLLPARRQTGAGWQPPLPLILAGWWGSSDEAKRAMLREHIEWAASHHALSEIDSFLRALPESEWAHG